MDVDKIYDLSIQFTTILCPVLGTKSQQYLRLLLRKSKICHVSGAGWSSLVARRAHNPKVVGSNPAPATNTMNTLKGVFFVSTVRKYRYKKKAPEGAIFLSTSGQRRPIGKVGFDPRQNRLRHFLLEFRGLQFTLFFDVTDKSRFDQN